MPFKVSDTVLLRIFSYNPSSGSSNWTLLSRLAVNIVAKSACYLRHARPSFCLCLCLSACISAAPIGWTSLKSDIGYFRGNVIYAFYPKQLTLCQLFKICELWTFYSGLHGHRHHVVSRMITNMCEKFACLILKLELVKEAADFFLCPYPESDELSPCHTILVR
jgi:hypothetical protein